MRPIYTSLCICTLVLFHTHGVFNVDSSKPAENYQQAWINRSNVLSIQSYSFDER